MWTLSIHAFHLSLKISQNCLFNCLKTIKGWTPDDFLLFNIDKSEVIISALYDIVLSVESLSSLSFSVKNPILILSFLWVRLWFLDQHINCLVRFCFYQLRNNAKLRPIVFINEMDMIIHVLIFFHLDYSNSLFTCLSKTSLNRLQVVQYATAK